MSRKSTFSIQCPHCKQQIIIERYLSYNYQIEGCDLQQILDDSWVMHRCPKCGKSFSFLGDLVFHDMARKSMFFFFPKGSALNEAQIKALMSSMIPSDYAVRIIKDSYAAFKEKILILESGLDDCACEVYKYQIKQNCGIKLECESRIVFGEDLEPKGVVFFIDKQKPVAFAFNLDDYNSALVEANRLRMGDKSIVDQYTIAEAIRGTTQ